MPGYAIRVWDGTKWVVSTGVKGAAGDQGIEGVQGPQGEVGPQGSDATVTSENIATALGYAPAPLASPSFTGTVSGVSSAMVGLGSVANTSDADKPVSTAVQAALALTVSKDSSTGAAELPAGTTAERPGGGAGKLRFNSTLNQFEGHTGTEWGTVGGGATGAAGNYVFNLNDQNVTGDFTIPVGKNAVTGGPIVVDDAVTVTVADGSTWTVV